MIFNILLILYFAIALFVSIFSFVTLIYYKVLKINNIFKFLLISFLIGIGFPLVFFLYFIFNEEEKGNL